MTLLRSDLVDFKLSEDWDLVVGDKGFDTVSGPEGVAQMCGVAVKLFLDEWFLDQSRGVDWFRLFQQKFNAEDVQSSVRRVLVRVPSVTLVVSVTARLDSTARRCDVQAVVSSEFGDVEVTASVGGSP